MSRFYTHKALGLENVFIVLDLFFPSKINKSIYVTIHPFMCVSVSKALTDFLFFENSLLFTNKAFWIFITLQYHNLTVACQSNLEHGPHSMPLHFVILQHTAVPVYSFPERFCYNMVKRCSLIRLHVYVWK